MPVSWAACLAARVVYEAIRRPEAGAQNLDDAKSPAQGLERSTCFSEERDATRVLQACRELCGVCSEGSRFTFSAAMSAGSILQASAREGAEVSRLFCTTA